jgi:hypothetical protein
MATVVKAERSKRHEEYARLRTRIFNHYRTLALIGGAPGARAHQLPPKLGHWSSRHSDLVRAVDVALWPIVRRIEELRAQRAPDLIKAQHTWLRRGDNFRRRSAPKVQTNPGEWPPKYK